MTPSLKLMKETMTATFEINEGDHDCMFEMIEGDHV